MKKVLIVTADKSVLDWRTKDKKIKEIQSALGEMFSVEIVHKKDIKPDVQGGRITHEWMDSFSHPLYREGNDFVLLHGTLAQKKRWKIQDTLRGAAQKDDDFVGEAYFFADESTQRGRYNQFIETSLHELSHIIARGTGANDNTHGWHDRNRTIKGIFKTYDMSKYQPVETEMKEKISFLSKILQGLQKLKLLEPEPSSLQPLVKRLSDELVRQMADSGHKVKVFQGFRSAIEQDKLYAKGRTEPGTIVTNARGGDSFHNYGVAVDVVFDTSQPWSDKHPWALLGKVGKSIGFEWGGDWKEFVDRPHFQLTMGYSLDDFKLNRVNYNKYK